MSLEYDEEETVLVDLDSHFYKSCYGEGKGWPIRKVYNDEKDYFIINHTKYGKPCPYHLKGKYGNLGWVKPSAIIRRITIKLEF